MLSFGFSFVLSDVTLKLNHFGFISNARKQEEEWVMEEEGRSGGK